MFKEAFLYGFGMAVDLSGAHFLQCEPPVEAPQKRILYYWQRTGDLLRQSVEKARPQIEAEADQLHLKLGD